MRFKLQQTLLALASAAILTHTAGAQGYSTTFDTTDGYAAGFALDGQPAADPQPWATNDFNSPSSVQFISGYSAYPGDLVVGFGGQFGSPDVLTTSGTSFLYKPVDLSNATEAAFNVRFTVKKSTNGFNDVFAWTFENSGVQLLQVKFSNFSATKYVIALEDGAGNPLGLSSPLDKLGYDAKYDLHVTVASDTTVTLAVTDGFGVTTSYYNGFIGGALPNLISDVAATWELGNTTNIDGNPAAYDNFGTNIMLFNNYSLVPEPTSALFALGLLAVTAGRRFRTRRS